MAAARQRAASRRPGIPGFRNADLSASDLEREVQLDLSARRLLQTAVERLGLSVRALHRALRVAQTIAELSESDRVTAAHLAEAVSYRLRIGHDANAESARLDKVASAP